MRKRKTAKIILISAAVAAVLCVVLLTVCNAVVIRSSSDGVIDASEAGRYDAILVFGCKVGADGTPSALLRDRVDCACALYFAGVSDRILMSGHADTSGYDEVAAMKKRAVESGVPEECIYTDPMGYTTYDSVLRAREVFGFDSVIAVTQEFHIYRAVYLARAVGMEAEGVAAPENGHIPAYSTVYIREPLARVKAVYCALFLPDSRSDGGEGSLGVNNTSINENGEHSHGIS